MKHNCDKFVCLSFFERKCQHLPQGGRHLCLARPIRRWLLVSHQTKAEIWLQVYILRHTVSPTNWYLLKLSFSPVGIHHPESVVGQEAEWRVWFGDHCKLEESHQAIAGIRAQLLERWLIHAEKAVAVVMPVQEVTLQEDFLWGIYTLLSMHVKKNDMADRCDVIRGVSNSFLWVPLQGDTSGQ